MSKVFDNLPCKDSMKETFATWEAKEVIIDDKKAYFELRKPGSEFCFVGFYRDGKDAFIYGDYGIFTFSHLTWLATPHNIDYDNISYIVEKLSSETRETLYEFSTLDADNDILEWFKERAECYYEDILNEDAVNAIIEWLRNHSFSDDADDCIKELYDNNHIDVAIARNLIAIAIHAMDSTSDENDYQTFLVNYQSEIHDVDDWESDLYTAGRRIKSTFFICLYALEVASEKLRGDHDTE